MLNESNGKKNFITNIREMSKMEKVLLGVESFSYVAAAGSLVATGASLVINEIGNPIYLGLCTVSFIANSQAFRLNRKLVKPIENVRKVYEDSFQVLPEEQNNQNEQEKVLRK